MLSKFNIRKALNEHFDSLYKESCDHNNGVPLNSFTRYPANWVSNYIDDVSTADFIGDSEIKFILDELREEEFSGSFDGWCWGECRYALMKVWREKSVYRVEF